MHEHDAMTRREIEQRLHLLELEVQDLESQLDRAEELRIDLRAEVQSLTIRLARGEPEPPQCKLARSRPKGPKPKPIPGTRQVPARAARRCG